MTNKTCRQCQAPFETTREDLRFLEEVSPTFQGKKHLVPPPDMCPRCRMIVRLARRNERFLYHRKCDLSGKQIIACYSTDKPFPVYENDEWYGDAWDATEFGRTYDFSRPFFEQFRELRDVTPRMARILEKPYENSDYCNTASRVKNCYLLFSSNEDEDCYFGSWVNQCKDCVDVLNVERCELCYECVGCRDCYNLRYARDCVNCRDSMYLRDCIGCKDCFGCTNQVEKQFVVFNTQKTKKEYQDFLAKVNTGSHREMQHAREQIERKLGDPIVKELHGVNLENCSGDYLRNCKNAHESFECNDCEDIAYCQCLQNAKDCMDHSYWGMGAALVYFTQACGYDPFRVLFCNLCWSGCSELIYCDHCFSSKNCFGCVGLRKDQYCILNKQYSKKEYEEIVPRIIQHMQSTSEYGQFFPSSISIYAYNETLAQEHEPLSKDDVLKRGWLWRDEEKREEKYLGPEYTIPDDSKDATDDILNAILRCEETGKPYKIIPQELAFYRRMRVPIPRLHPDERHKRRLSLRNPRTLWNRHCGKCKKPVQTTYSPDRPETVYCERCYLQTVH